MTTSPLLDAYQRLLHHTQDCRACTTTPCPIGRRLTDTWRTRRGRPTRRSQ
ncbi:hypothetical protein ACN2WE_04830 [Streptomyces sp. cg28]|uniref:hypothetical protein n=1 Tax=Streptomyces sp. cg28 TaxID=3403457 RepID=UPI003B20EBA8